jgi:hypothetical protein
MPPPPSHSRTFKSIRRSARNGREEEGNELGSFAFPPPQPATAEVYDCWLIVVTSTERYNLDSEAINARASLL